MDRIQIRFFYFQVVAFFGFLIITCLVSLIFYICFEAPVLTLLNIGYEKLVKRKNVR